MTWKYTLQSKVGEQVAHVIAGIKTLNYDDLVKAILTSSEQQLPEWKTNMDVRAHRDSFILFYFLVEQLLISDR